VRLTKVGLCITSVPAAVAAAAAAAVLLMQFTDLNFQSQQKNLHLFLNLDLFISSECFMSVWQGMAMDSMKYHLGPPCLTLLRPAGAPPLKQPYVHFTGSPPAGQAACGHLLPLWTPHAIRLWNVLHFHV
jgi:hypothetical protein